MEQQQELEWEAAQNTKISVDLVSAANTQLQFLAAVDRNRWLYQGPGLNRAIYRYNAYWLPLLAKHSESPLVEGSLVVPLDCEWVWHCHRLNPIRYKQDCEEFYGRILDIKNVVSSVEGVSRGPTEEAWTTLFPGEPYELDEDNTSGEGVVGENFTKYDLISAVERQSPFFYQVSGLHMNEKRYMEGSVARYKGFLHLIKRNKERGIRSFSVPTYDVDLIWHTHQLHPLSYCQDLVKIMGKILEHDDTDSDRTKGQKLDNGFSNTTNTFQNMYGRPYCRAGAMYKGSAPSPVRLTPYSPTITNKVPTFDQTPKVALPALNVFEVMLELIGVRDLPEGDNGSVYVSLSKSQPDMIFNARRILKISSESDEKQVVTFQCQPTGHLLFDLMSTPSSKTIGTTSVSLEDFLSPDSKLTVEKWLDFAIMDSKPVGLRVAISVTVPAPAPQMLHVDRSGPLSKNWTHVADQYGNMVLNLQMRSIHKSKGKKKFRRRVVVGTMASGKTYALAAFAKSTWCMVNSPWSLKFPNATNDDGHLLEMTGPHTVRLFLGGRLDYESGRCEKHKSEGEHESHLITAVKFSAEDPYGTAVALLDTKVGTVKVKEEWFLLPGLIVTFVLGNVWRKEGRNGMGYGVGTETKEAGGCENMAKSGACFGSGCFGSGGGCGNMAESGTCFGSGCFGSGGSCGTMAKSGACFGSGCFGSGGGSCETMAKGGACFGNGGGGGCGTMAKSGSGCFGSGGVSDCGTTGKSGACFGSGCFGSGGSCGTNAKSGTCFGSGMMKGQSVAGNEIKVA